MARYNSPLVVPKYRQVNLLGDSIALRQTLTLDIRNQTVADVRFLLKAITIDEVDTQQRLGNEANRFAVDGREGKSISDAKCRTEVTFGNALDQVMIRAIMKSVRAQTRLEVGQVIRSAPGLKREDISGFRKLSRPSSWEWVIAEGKGAPAKPTNPFADNVQLSFGQSLIYRTISKYMGLANMFAARIDAGWKGGKLWSKGRSGGKGFLFKSINTIKRNRLLRDYTVRVTFSRRYIAPGEIYHPNTPPAKMPLSTPAIVIRAKRKRGNYKRIT